MATHSRYFNELGGSIDADRESKFRTLFDNTFVLGTKVSKSEVDKVIMKHYNKSMFRHDLFRHDLKKASIVFTCDNLKDVNCSVTTEGFYYGFALKPAQKSPKLKIPKKVKTDVWNTYIGADINKHRCLCCKRAYICNVDFSVGHVLSEKDGGTMEIANLRPICATCNSAMSTMNMVDFIKKYGYYL